MRDRIVAETRGNPLALLELPRAMTPAELAGGYGLPEAMPMASRIEQGFRRRLESLPTQTRQLLLTAAAEPVGDAPLVCVLATPYLIVRHVRGHRAGHAVLRQRLGRAFHALLDIAPRLLAAIRRSRPAR